MAISSEDRKRIAAQVGVNEQYLYQCLTGRRDMNPAEARRVERESGGSVKRWDICQKSWYLIWPELIGSEGAPPHVQGSVPGNTARPLELVDRRERDAPIDFPDRRRERDLPIGFPNRRKGAPSAAASNPTAHTERAVARVDRRQLRLPFTGRGRRGEG